jgi:hypothetical protein
LLRFLQRRLSCLSRRAHQHRQHPRHNHLSSHEDPLSLVRSLNLLAPPINPALPNYYQQKCFLP